MFERFNERRMRTLKTPVILLASLFAASIAAQEPATDTATKSQNHTPRIQTVWLKCADGYPVKDHPQERDIKYCQAGDKLTKEYQDAWFRADEAFKENKDFGQKHTILAEAASTYFRDKRKAEEDYWSSTQQQNDGTHQVELTLNE